MVELQHVRAMRGLRGSFLLGTAALFVATPAWGQAAPEQQGEQAESGSALDEVITVTARKRTESLQDTPISITAFSDRALEARGIQSTDGLAQLTPNMTLQNIAASSSLVTCFIAMRAEWKVNSSGRIAPRAVSIRGISVSIVVLELGTIWPIR